MSNPNESNEIFEMGEELEHHLVMGESLQHLRNCPHFQKVILQGYLEQKVLASVSLLAVPQIQESGKRGGIMEDLVAASNLQFFFRQIDQFYEGAKSPVLSDMEEAALETHNSGH